VFIAAVKNPTRQTDTLKLLLKLIKEPSIRLVGNDLLAEEMLRYAELLKSQTAAVLVSALLDKMEFVQVSRKYRKICKAYSERQIKPMCFMPRRASKRAPS
jgi:hypothetical protein